MDLLIVFAALLNLVYGQRGQYEYNEPKNYLKPQPVILMHKQALSHDGSFNYAFAADNGLKQGESISPDGTRSGAYSYVDPQGQTISVRYTAGKDGFQILEGDHVPKAPIPAAVHQPAQYQGYYPNPNQRVEEDDGQYHEENERRGSPAYNQRERQTHQPSYLQSAPVARYRVQEEGAYKEPQEEEHKGPHSFGSGYSFQFGG